MPNNEQERMRDYCTKLCKTIARYATPDELAALVQTLDSFKISLMAERYAPGLNDATYDLYAAFNLRAPKQVADTVPERNNGL